MNSQVDFPKLAKMIKARRRELGMGLRDTADAIQDVSPSTLSRIEGERVHDLNVSTFLGICDWLAVEPQTFILSDRTDAHPTALNVTDSIEVQLRAAKELSERDALMLAKMMRAAYETLQDEQA